MDKIKNWGLCWVVVCIGLWAHAQSPAALEKLSQRYDEAQLEDMRLHAHHKYVGLQLFYAASFQVIDAGQARPATEDEIRRIALDDYNGLRQEKSDVSVHDATLQKDIVLLSRHNFEELVLQRLSDADRSDYLAYKAQALRFHEKSN